jgi:hypothetical protein
MEKRALAQKELIVDARNLSNFDDKIYYSKRDFYNVDIEIYKHTFYLQDSQSDKVD